MKKNLLTKAVLGITLAGALTLNTVAVSANQTSTPVQNEQKVALSKVSNVWKARTLEETKEEIKRQKELGLDVYVIQWGDTLGTIATATNQNVDELAKLNELQNKNLIITGSTLKGVLNKDVAVETSTLVASHNETSANNIQTVAPSVTVETPTQTEMKEEKVDLTVSKEQFNKLVEIEKADLTKEEKEQLGDEVAKAETKEDLAKVDEKLQEMTGETKVNEEDKASEKTDMNKETETVKEETSSQPEVSMPTVEAPKEETPAVTPTPEVKPNEGSNYIPGYDSEGRELDENGKPLNNEKTHNGYMSIEDYVPGQRRPELAGKTLIVSVDWADGLVLKTMTWDKDGYPLDGHAVRPETQPSGQTDPETTTTPSVETGESTSGTNNETTETTGATRMSPVGNGGEFATFEEADAYALSKYNDDDWALNSGFTSYRVEPIMWTDGAVTYTIHFI